MSAFYIDAPPQAKHYEPMLEKIADDESSDAASDATEDDLLSKLLELIRIDDVDSLKQMEESRLEKLISVSNDAGLYAIHEAAANNASKCLRMIVRRMSSLLNQVDGTGKHWTPLHHASDKGHLRIVKRLLRQGADAFAKSSLEDAEETPAHLAALKGHLPIIKFLIESFPELTMGTNGEGDFPIHRAAFSNQIEVLEYFVAIGVDINVPDQGKWQRTCLHQAASNGHVNLVKWLVKNGADVYAKSSPEDDEELPVHLAAAFGHLQVSKFFIENYPELNTATNADGDYPIHRAASSNQTKLVEFFISTGVEVNAADEGPWKRNCLHKAAINGHLGLVIWLAVRNGANVFAKSSPEDLEGLPVHLAAAFGHLTVVQFFIDNYPVLKTAKNGDGNFPIHKAALANQLEIVEYFISSSIGMDVNVPDEGKTKRTCLHKAAEYGHVDLVKWLISKGADVLAQSSCEDDQDMAVHLAAVFGHLPVVDFFIANYPELKTATNYYPHGNYPIHKAALGNQLEIVDYFISRIGLDVDIPDEGNRRTCLHHAASHGHLDLIKWLISKGANVSAKSKTQATPLHLAAEFGHLNVVQYIVENYPELKTATNKQNDCPIHRAALTNQIEVVEYLISAGVDVNLPGDMKQTCLHIAAQQGYVDLVQVLIDKGADVCAKGGDQEEMPVHCAAFSGHLQALKLLIEKHPDQLMAKTKLGETALERARALRHVGPPSDVVVNWLLSARAEAGVTLEVDLVPEKPTGKASFFWNSMDYFCEG